MGAIYKGKGGIARQRCACVCFSICAGFVWRALGGIAGLVCCPPACGADVQHAQPFKAGVAVVVVTFIALLELVKENLVEITQAEAFAPIYVRLAYTPT